MYLEQATPAIGCWQEAPACDAGLRVVGTKQVMAIAQSPPSTPSAACSSYSYMPYKYNYKIPAKYKYKIFKLQIQTGDGYCTIIHSALLLAHPPICRTSLMPLPMYLSLYQFTYLPVGRPTYLGTYAPTYQGTYVPTYLSTYAP